MSRQMQTVSPAPTPAQPQPAQPRFGKQAQPVIVLVLICAVVGLLLGSGNSLTLPTIAANREARAEETYAALLPGASGFTPQDCTVPGVSACVEADGTGGFAIIAQAKGYSGYVPFAVGFDSQGTIVGVIGMDNTETPGLGTKILEPAFTGQFLGRSADIIDAGDIDVIAGATISSKAALAAINQAITAYTAGGGPSSGGPSSTGPGATDATTPLASRGAAGAEKGA